MRRKDARRIRAGIAASKMSELGQQLWLFNVADDLARRAYLRSRYKRSHSSPDSGSTEEGDRG